MKICYIKDEISQFVSSSKQHYLMCQLSYKSFVLNFKDEDSWFDDKKNILLNFEDLIFEDEDW